MSTLHDARLALLPICLALGCAPDATSEEESYSTTAISAPNGRTYNGRWPNGRWPNGRWPNGVRLSGVRVAGGSVSNVSVQGSQLVGVDASGQTLSGHDFIGAELVAFFDDGTTAPLRIDDVDTINDPSPSLVNEGVIWTYTVSATIDGVTGPLCDDGSGQAIAAYALSGRWDYREGVTGGGAKIDDPSAFTLACRQVGALGKCVDAGYKPWASIRIPALRRRNVQVVSLSPYHQACVRMLRADYCGDGASWTVDGTEIDVYDDLGIQIQATSWTIDAEWTANGALCAGELSLTATMDPVPLPYDKGDTTVEDRRASVRDDVDGLIATCYSAIYSPTCGTFANGALLIDRYD